MNRQLHDSIETSPEEWSRVRRSDFYTLMEILTAIQTGLVTLWNPDATTRPLGPANPPQAREALSTALVDLKKWIEQVHSTGPRQ